MSNDLTRLRDVAEAVNFYDREHIGAALHPHTRAYLRTFDPPTVAALIDRVERAERERDELREKIEFWVDERDLEIEKGDDARTELATLRAAVKGLADEWGPQSDDGPVRMVIDCANAADALRGLLTEGVGDANADPFTPADLGQLE